jgi:hypothetical protein
LPRRTEPRADSRGMGISLMMPVVLGVGHAGGHHGPVHENEAEGQGPYG